jgi:pyruvate kinase
MISRHRPLTPIFAVTSSERTQRQLALVWGVNATLVSAAMQTEDLVQASLSAAMQQGLVQSGDVVVVTGGVPLGIAGRTNMIQVRVVSETF